MKQLQLSYLASESEPKSKNLAFKYNEGVGESPSIGAVSVLPKKAEGTRGGSVLGPFFEDTKFSTLSFEQATSPSEFVETVSNPFGLYNGKIWISSDESGWHSFAITDHRE